MPDKIVYLISKHTKHTERETSVSFVDDAQLTALLSDGWELSTTIPARDIGTSQGKRIRATTMVLKRASENRGVALVEDQGFDPDRSGGRGMTVVQMDGFGNQRQISLPQAMMGALDKVSRALALSGGASHLGGLQDHSMPGLQIISGEMISKAYDMGLGAAMRGMDKSTNPFPLGSKPSSKWLQGYQQGRSALGAQQVADPVAIAEARAAGAAAMKDYGEDDEVYCPYPSYSPLRAPWIEGFRDAGGRVED